MTPETPLPVGTWRPDLAAADRPGRMTPELAADLLGVVGLVVVVLAIGGLTGTWWWSLGAAGLVMVGLSYSAHNRIEAERQYREDPEAKPKPIPLQRESKTA